MAAGADGNDRAVAGERLELAAQLRQRHVDGGADVPTAPFVRLADVEDEDVPAFQPFTETGRVRARSAGEEAHASVSRGALDDPSELGAMTRRGLKEAFRIIARAQKGLALEAGLRLR